MGKKKKRMILTQEQRREIVAKKMDGASFRALGREYGVSATTIKNVTSAEVDFEQKCAQKKQEADEDFLSFMNDKTTTVKRVVDLCIDHLADESKYPKATLQQLATVYGIIMDKQIAVANYHLDRDRIEIERQKLELQKQKQDADSQQAKSMENWASAVLRMAQSREGE